jgi:multidrug resistance efflux pump
MIFHGLRSAYRSIRPMPAWRAGGTLWRSAVVAALFLGGAWLVLSFRLEQRTEVAFQLETAGAVPVFSPRAAQRVDAVRYDDTVVRDQQLTQLRDRDMELQIDSLTGRLQEATSRLATLSIRAQQYPALFAELATLRSVHADLRRQLATLREDEQRLVVRAPVEGVVLRPHVGYAGPRANSIELPASTGAPLDGPNRGGYLNKGELICLVGRPRDLHAIAQVDAADVGQITVGNQVRLRFNQIPGETIVGDVAEIGLSNLQSLERHGNYRRIVGVRAVSLSDGLSPAKYFVRMNLDQHPPWVRHGSGGVARIVTGDRTVGQMIQQFCYRVFRFHL